MNLLCQTYDIVKRQGAFLESGHPLTPVGFIQKKADICVTLDARGNFFDATKIEKDADAICIPSSPEAEGRTSGVAAFPLCDQLKYVAGDMPKCEKYFLAYASQLEDWANSPGAPAVLATLSAYIGQKRLLRDLTNINLISDAAQSGKLLACFKIQTSDGSEERLWMREDVQESWLARAAAREGERKLCFVEGRSLPVMENHPKVLVFGNAKLISSQDTGTIFQYKGRFKKPDEAVTVSYDASVKAHNTLLWLLKRQGKTFCGASAVAWSTEGMACPLPVDDWESDALEEIEAQEPDTFASFGREVRRALSVAQGFNAGDYKAEALDQVAVIVLQAATNGRVSIVYYQEMARGDYIKRLETWYAQCAWRFSRYHGEGDSRKLYTGVSSPTAFEVAQAVMGKRDATAAREDPRGSTGAAKQMRALKLRLLHCIVDGANLPRNIERAAFYRVSAPLGFTDGNGRFQQFDWLTALSTYCALLHKAQLDYHEEVIDVKLDENCRDRSYLYGRLLAIVDYAESQAIDDQNYRMTNAFRYMQIFRHRPLDTWTKLHELAQPYFRKLGRNAEWYKKLISDVTVLFNAGDYESKQPLDGRFLQGYYCQRQDFYTKKSDKAKPAAAGEAADTAADKA